jgi:DNA-binding NarL/FixJ family response regulator
LDGFAGNPISSGDRPLAACDPMRSIALVDDNTLRRDCLRNSLISQRVSWDIAAFASIEEWRAAAAFHPPLAAVLFHAGPQELAGSELAGKIKDFISELDPKPVIILGDSDDIVHVINALDCGVRGYIPSSVTIEVCIEAINLALAGGVFLPASSLLAMRQKIMPDMSRDSSLTKLFTPRQIKVADAIRQGKPNKIIAYELCMCESTVKVHIRNIMKILKATNRTEVAYKLSGMPESAF